MLSRVTGWVLKTVAMVAVLLSVCCAHKHFTAPLDQVVVAQAPLSADAPYYESTRRVRQSIHNLLTQEVPTKAPGALLIASITNGTNWVADQVELHESTAATESLVRISDRFGMRFHPILKRKKMHNGVDFAAPRGTPIVAVADGVVAYRNWRGGAGRFVKVQHDGYSSAYAHMSRFAKNVRPGTKVEAGQVIGYVGASGLATGNHLHFSIMVDGRFVDPIHDGFERLEPIREAQILVDFERGVLKTLTNLQLMAFEVIPPESLDEDDFDLMFDDSFL